MAKVVFKYGTRAQYDALQTKDSSTLYFLTDTGEIYRGDVNLARGSHYEVVRSEGESDADAIARAIGNNPPVKDDIVVVKTLLADDKYSYVSFIHDGSAWKAMDGNYDAENVYFDSDLTFTKAVGYVTLTNGQATVAAKGKNVKQVLESIFAKEEKPNVTAPKASISYTSGVSTSYEVGTKVAPSYTASLTSGSYTYGPATGITATAYSVTDGTNTLTTASGTMPEMTIADDTNYRLTATISHGEGAVPKTNLGNNDESSKIAAGNKTAYTSYIKGYRKMFYGADISATADQPVNSMVVRALHHSMAPAAKTLDTCGVTDVPGAKRFIVAIPTSSTLSVKKVTMPSSLNADVTDLFVKKDNVSVEGANGHTGMDYKVWVYEPANLSQASTFDIVIG